MLWRWNDCKKGGVRTRIGYSHVQIPVQKTHLIFAGGIRARGGDDGMGGGTFISASLRALLRTSPFLLSSTTSSISSRSTYPDVPANDGDDETLLFCGSFCGNQGCAYADSASGTLTLLFNAILLLSLPMDKVVSEGILGIEGILGTEAIVGTKEIVGAEAILGTEGIVGAEAIGMAEAIVVVEASSQ